MWYFQFNIVVGIKFALGLYPRVFLKTYLIESQYK